MVGRIFTIVLVLAAATAPGRAQPPQLRPEHRPLEFFVGKWGEGPADPSASSGAAGVVDSCEWFDGRFHLVCRSQDAKGRSLDLSVLGFDPAQGVYTRFNITREGHQTMATGKLDGKTWRWRGGDKPGAKTMHFTWTETSPDSYAYVVGTGVDGPTEVLDKGNVVRRK